MVSVIVAPGFTRDQTVAPLLARSARILKIISNITYLLALPILLIITKSSKSATQSILHTLFLPHPLKASFGARPTPGSSSSDEVDTRVVEGGKLYRDCAPVVLPGTAEIEILGVEGIGRGVWEYFEAGLKVWEEQEAVDFRAREELAAASDKGKGKEMATEAEQVYAEVKSKTD